MGAGLAETDRFLDPRSERDRFLPEDGADELLRAGVVRGVYAGGAFIEGMLPSTGV